MRGHLQMPAKKSKAIQITVAALVVIVPLLLWASATNPPLGRAGAPGETTCAACHKGGRNAGHVSLAFSGGGTAYTPGAAQQVTVTVTDPNASVYGFEMTAVKASAITTTPGTFTAVDANTVVRKGTGSFVNKFYAAQTNDRSSTFRVNWIPPSESVGNVTFYVAALGGDGSGKPASNQSVYISNATLTPPVAHSPTIVAVPALLQFAYAQNGTAPVAQSVALSSSAGQIDYTVTTSQTWLNATPPRGSTPGSLSVSVNPSGLAVGKYSGNVTVYLTGTANSWLKIPVTLVVNAAPSIAVTPSTLAFTAPAGSVSPPTQSATVNSRTAALGFSVTSVTSSGGAWLTATPAIGNTPGTIHVSVNPGSLAAGTYAGMVLVASPGTVNGSQAVAVTFVVTQASLPTLALANTAMSFTAQAGGAAPVSQTVATASTGTAIKFTTESATTSGRAWLTATPVTGTTPETISISVNPLGMAVGTYTGTVTVVGAGAANSPPTVAVTLVVTPAPLPNLAVAPATLSFTAQAGGAAPLSQRVTTTSSKAAINYTVTATTGGGGMWLTAIPASGATPGSLSVSANPAALVAGNYAGKIFFDSAEAANSPQSVAVTFVVTPPPLPNLTVKPDTLSFEAPEGGAAPAPQFVATGSTGAAIKYTTSCSTNSGGGWLSATPANGATPESISVSANPGTLPAGTYAGSVSIFSEGAANTPETIAVTLVVTAAAPPNTPASSAIQSER